MADSILENRLGILMGRGRSSRAEADISPSARDLGSAFLTIIDQDAAAQARISSAIVNLIASDLGNDRQFCLRVFKCALKSPEVKTMLFELLSAETTAREVMPFVSLSTSLELNLQIRQNEIVEIIEELPEAEIPGVTLKSEFSGTAVQNAIKTAMASKFPPVEAPNGDGTKLWFAQIKTKFDRLSTSEPAFVRRLISISLTSTSCLCERLRSATGRDATADDYAKFLVSREPIKRATRITSADSNSDSVFLKLALQINVTFRPLNVPAYVHTIIASCNRHVNCRDEYLRDEFIVKESSPLNIVTFL